MGMVVDIPTFDFDDIMSSIDQGNTVGQELRITTFGGLSIQYKGETVTGFVSRKVEALLVYIAANQREHPREVLGELLWDDLPQERTLSYLRTALSSLQKQLAPFLCVTRQTIAVDRAANFHLDLIELDQVLTEAENQWEERGDFSRLMATRLEEALALYRGGFMEGFHIRNSREFEGWMVLTQERMQSRVLEAFFHLGKHAGKRGAYSTGIDLTNRALQIDPLWEEAHRQLMLLLAQSGQRSAAINQFELCRKILDEELGIEPDEDTTALFERIQTGEITTAKDDHHLNNLPIRVTPFVDRPQAIEQIVMQLDKPECRLLTLVGAGGVGKTRLALEVASMQLPEFPHGVFFINFTPVMSTDHMVNTIANALKITLKGKGTPEQELIQKLQDQEMLLVLDNLEHLIQDVDIISHILDNAPCLKIIVTSRERLNLAQEWLYNVDSLPIPGKNDPEPEAFSSIQLFAMSAQRVQNDFMVEDHLEAVIDICKTVDGLPLAIELAASWVRMLTPYQILREIHNGLDILQTSLRNIPERHRSIYAVFESSWKMLTEAEREVFRRLAVFRGGFTQEAAQIIAGSSLMSLIALVDKSLLMPVNERYEMHLLLSQYALEKLNQDAKIKAEVQTKHSEYFARFMEERDPGLSNHPSRTAFDEVMAEIDNVWSAWQHALETHQYHILEAFLRPLYRLHDSRSRYYEIRELFSRLLAHMEQHKHEQDELWARTLVLKGALDQHVSDYDDALLAFEQSLPVIKRTARLWELRIALNALGNIAYSRGKYPEARDYFEQARDLMQDSDDPLDRARLAAVLFRLSDIAAVVGDYEGARQILEESLQIADSTSSKQNRMRLLLLLGDINLKLGDLPVAETNFQDALEMSEELEAPTSAAVALVSLGRVMYAMGKYAKAEIFIYESVKLCDELRNFWNKAFSLMHLGRTAHRQEDYATAKAHFREAIALSKQIGSRWITAVTLHHQARTKTAMGDLSSARYDLLQALEMAWEIHATPVVLDIITSMAEVNLLCGEPQQAFEFASFAAGNTISEYETRIEAQRIIADSHIDTVNTEWTLERIVTHLLD